MDRDRRPSAHSTFESQRPDLGRGSQQHTNNNFKDLDTRITVDPTKHNIPSQPVHSTSSKPLDSLKHPTLTAPQFTIPPLPATLPRRGSASPGTRFSPNPARQIFSYPMSYPQDAPSRDSRMSDDDGPPPSQRRKLNSPDSRNRSLKSDDESDSRRGSSSKGALSYDPVHEYHQQAHQHHHDRRPSSVQSHQSMGSSFSQHSSNQDGDEPSSPVTGDTPASRDGKKRKHKCQECGQFFTRLHNLKSHLLTHSQEKPFVCTTCGHKFRRLHDLKRHHKLHTGERPYICPGCQRSFARMDALNRHRKPGGECSLHNMSTSSTGSQQNTAERRMSLPPGFGRPPSQGSTSPLPPAGFAPPDSTINPALATAAHGASYPPTHLPPKQKHRYQHHESGEASPGFLAPPSSNIAYGRSPPLPFGPTGNGRGVQPPPLVIPSNTAGPTLSPIHSHHYSPNTQGTSSSSAGRSAQDRSPIPPITREEGGNQGPTYSLTESPRGMTPPPLQAPPPLAVPPSTLPLLPSPGTLIPPSPRNSYDRSPRHSVDRSVDVGRNSERGYFDSIIERNGRLEKRVDQLESLVGILWEERENVYRRQHQQQPDDRRDSG